MTFCKKEESSLYWVEVNINFKTKPNLLSSIVSRFIQNLLSITRQTVGFSESMN